jgi:hypothetical protein
MSIAIVMTIREPKSIGTMPNTPSAGFQRVVKIVSAALLRTGKLWTARVMRISPVKLAEKRALIAAKSQLFSKRGRGFGRLEGALWEAL